MKKLKSFILTAIFLIAVTLSYSQNIGTFTAPTGSVDSANSKNSTKTISTGILTINPSVTWALGKNTATGYALLYGSCDNVSWYPIFTKKVAALGATPINYIGQDTLNYSIAYTVGARQSCSNTITGNGSWVVNPQETSTAYYYKVVWIGTAGKITPRVDYTNK